MNNRVGVILDKLQDARYTDESLNDLFIIACDKLFAIHRKFEGVKGKFSVFIPMEKVRIGIFNKKIFGWRVASDKITYGYVTSKGFMPETTKHNKLDFIARIDIIINRYLLMVECGYDLRWYRNNKL